MTLLFRLGAATMLLAATACREPGMPPRKQAQPLHPVVLDEAHVAQVNLATAAEDEEGEIELALRSVPPAEKEKARSLLRGGTPTGADDPETVVHLQRLAAIRTARIRHEMAQQSHERSLPTMRVRLAIVDRLPMRGARAVVLRQRNDDVDGTILVPSAGATGGDVDLAMRALQRSVRSSTATRKTLTRIAIRAATGANQEAASYWSDVIDVVKRRPDAEVPGIGIARFTLVNVKLAVTP